MNICLKSATKIYKPNIYALRDLELNVESGEFLTVMGPSGSGKSTLLKILAGIERLTMGELYFDGIAAENISADERDVALVFQEYVLYPNKTVYENILAGAKFHGIPYDEADRRAVYAMKLFGLTDAKDQRPKSLSGGQQQRTALAKALVRRSRLVLMDEPMSNVSEEARAEYCELLAELKRELPESTFIYVTHNPREAIKLGDRVAFMDDGRIVGCAKSSILRRFPIGEDMSAVFGSLELASAFSIPCRIDPECFTVADEQMPMPASISSRLLRMPSEARAEFFIEKLSKTPKMNTIPLVFSVLENYGEGVRLSVEQTEFYLPRRTNLEAGMRIRMYYDPREIVIHDSEGRCTAKYALDGNIFPTDSIKNPLPSFAGAKRIFVPFDAITPAAGHERFVIKPERCLAEDLHGEYKIGYFDVKGVDGVVSAMLPIDCIPSQNKKLHLSLDLARAVKI